MTSGWDCVNKAVAFHSFFGASTQRGVEPAQNFQEILTQSLTKCYDPQEFDLKAKEGLAIVTNLVVPKTGGMNTTKVNVVRWIKKEGDALKRGEPVVELETEKVSYELDAPIEGVLLKIVVREPAEVEVGGLLGYIGKAGDAIPAS